MRRKNETFALVNNLGLNIHPAKVTTRPFRWASTSAWRWTSSRASSGPPSRS
jgi:hypothetical protein